MKTKQKLPRGPAREGEARKSKVQKCVCCRIRPAIEGRIICKVCDKAE